VHTRAGGAVGSLAVERVDWSRSPLAVGRVRAVADAGNTVAVLGDGGASWFTAGALVSRDARKTDWVSAGVIPGPDGSSRWMVGVDAQGRVYRLTPLGAIEDVSGRYGLETDPIADVTGFGSGLAGFLVGRQLVVADRAAVRRYPTGPFRALSGASGLVAGITDGGVQLLRARDGSITEFPLPGVSNAAVGSDGRVYATTPRAVYATDVSGRLSLLYAAEGDTVQRLVVSGGRTWFTDGGELGIVDGDTVKETAGAAVPPGATLASSPSGDVWVLSGATVSRYRPATTPGRVDESWAVEMAPVFARACARCHLPDGVSGTDLSTAASWAQNRSAIVARVVVDRSMPPRGNLLEERDREAIRAWASTSTPEK